MNVHRSNRIGHRRDFGRLLNDLQLTGDAVEVGVHRGEFAEMLLTSWRGRMLYLVDPWRHLPGYVDPVADGDRDEDYAAAMKRMLPFQDRVRVCRNLSVEAASTFDSLSLDFVYIDADHARDAVLTDIKAWWPLVRKGGILAGHDWFGGWGMNVRWAVNSFFAERVDNSAVFTIRDDDGAGSWFIHKRD